MLTYHLVERPPSMNHTGPAFYGFLLRRRKVSYSWTADCRKVKLTLGVRYCLRAPMRLCADSHAQLVV